jgi:hypothetical protein
MCRQKMRDLWTFIPMLQHMCALHALTHARSSRWGKDDLTSSWKMKNRADAAACLPLYTQRGKRWFLEVILPTLPLPVRHPDLLLLLVITLFESNYIIQLTDLKSWSFFSFCIVLVSNAEKNCGRRWAVSLRRSSLDMNDRQRRIYIFISLCLFLLFCFSMYVCVFIYLSLISLQSFSLIMKLNIATQSKEGYY